MGAEMIGGYSRRERSDAESLRDDLLAYIEAGRNRWTPLRKIAALTVVRSRFLPAEDLCERFDISSGELDSWARAFDTGGAEGLLVTRRAALRSAPRRRPRQAHGSPSR